MLKKYKKELIISSVLILLPILVGLFLWNQLPGDMPSHWGGNGSVDGYMNKAFMVFGFPLILLGLHWLAIWVTLLDPKNKDQNKKAIGILFWIIPVISVGMHTALYCAALGISVHLEQFVLPMLGVLFIIMGNYFPKVKQNSTFGIKISWTLANEENWNKTHRLASKLWVIGGLLFLLAAFLPGKWIVVILIPVLVVLLLTPVIYSYRLYKKQMAAGGVFVSYHPSKFQRNMGVGGTVFAIAIVIFVVIMMFTGDIDFELEENQLTITADYYEDFAVSYDKVDTITYLESYEGGLRVNGFGSPRLVMGRFENPEYGYYTLYAYTGCESGILLRNGEEILIISAETEAETRALYTALLERIE